MDTITVGIDVSKDRLDVAVVRVGRRLRSSVMRDGLGVGRAPASDCSAASSRWRRPAASRPWSRRHSPARACRWWWSTRRRSGPSPRRSGTREDRPDRRRGDRALCRGDQTGASGPARRGDPIAGRAGRPPAADHRDDRRRTPARSRRVTAPHLPRALRALLKALEKELAELDADIDDAVRGSPAWRDKEDLLASVARHRLDHRPNADCRTARARARSTGDRSQPRRPRSVHPPVRPMARQASSAAAEPRPPALFMGAMVAARHNPRSRRSASAWSPPANPKWSP